MFSHKPKRPALVMSVPTTKKPTPQPHREVKPWDDRDKVIAIVDSFLGKYRSRISELRTWQRKLLVQPVPADANRQLRESYFKAVKCAVEQFNGMRPAPVRVAKSRRYAPSMPVVTPSAPHPATVEDHTSIMYTVYGSGQATLSTGKATVRDIRSAPKKVDNNGYGKTRRELTSDERATADAQSATAMAKKEEMFARKTIPVVKADKGSSKNGKKGAKKDSAMK